MKKFTALLLAALMILSASACANTAPAETAAATEAATTQAPATEAPTTAAPETEAPTEAAKAPVAEEVRGVTVPAFSVTVNGIAVDNDMMAAYPVYQVEVTTTNSSGTVSTTTYAGFAMKDVLDAAGLTEQYIWLEATADDGYAVEYTGDLFANETLLAISQNGTQFKSSPWFAPGLSETTGDYLKGCVSILVNTKEEAPVIEETKAEKEEKKEEKKEEAGDLELTGDAPDKQDKTDKVTFNDFSFKVNDADVTNAELEGLSIYKVSVVVENSKGTRSEATYTGYVLSDVLSALGYDAPTMVKAVADDGYESELSPEDIASEYTIVAIEKDKETGENGTIWVAPCQQSSSGKYAKGVTTIVVE